MRLCVTLYFFLVCATASRPPLRLNGVGTFTIMQLTDTHFWDESTRDERTNTLISKLLQYETPDFIAHTGDVVHSSFLKNGKTSYVSLWNKMVRLFGGTPYAVALGNHDQDKDFITTQEILQNDQTNAHCYSNAFQNGPNPYDYYIDVLSSAGNETAWRLWFFNSGPDLGWCENQRSAGCVPADVISWAYMHGCDETIPSVVFSHIPIAALLDVSNKTGTRQDNNPIPAVNTGLDTFALRCGARAMSFGHMHGNDFAGTYARHLPGRGLAAALYGYGRNSGYGYQGAAKLQRGARMFRLYANKTIDTWVRQEDGTRVKYETYDNEWLNRANAWIMYMCLIATGVVIVSFTVSLTIVYEKMKNEIYSYKRLQPTRTL